MQASPTSSDGEPPPATPLTPRFYQRTVTPSAHARGDRGTYIGGPRHRGHTTVDARSLALMHPEVR